MLARSPPRTPRLSNDIKNYLEGQIWYRSLDPFKKRRQKRKYNFFFG